MSCSRTKMQWSRWGSNPQPLGLKSSTLPLSHCPPTSNIIRKSYLTNDLELVYLATRSSIAGWRSAGLVALVSSAVVFITVLSFTWNVLTLNAPIATKVVCFSRLLKCLRSLYGKQWGPRSDCSYGSSLFWVHAVCSYT